MKWRILSFVIGAHLLVLTYFYAEKKQIKEISKPIFVQSVKLKPKKVEVKPTPPPSPPPQIKRVKKAVKKTAPKKIDTPKAPPQKKERTPIDLDTQIQAFFKSFNLPEYGKVVLKITIKNNKVIRIETIECQSEENLNYLKLALEKFTLPFDKNQIESDTFIIHFDNDLKE